MFDISIIIVTFNSVDVITKCLSHIRNDIESLEVEIIIIDNHSEDKTLLEIKQFLSSNKSNPVIKLIENKENLGYAKAVNQGLKIADGDFILLINPDVFIVNGFFRKSIQFLSEEKDTGLIAPQHISLNNDVISSCREFPNHLILLWDIIGLSKLFKKSRVFGRWRMGYFDFKSTKEVDQPMGACLFGKRDIINKIGFMDERFSMFFNDVDWCRRFKEKGYKIIFYPEIKVYHIVGHSVMQKRYAMIFYSHYGFFLYFLKYFKKWWQRLLNVFFGIILFIGVIVRIGILFIKNIVYSVMIC